MEETKKPVVKKEVADPNKQLVIQNFVVARPPERTQFDISAWRNAIESAETIYAPNRTRLYDIYEDAMLDPHLSRQWEKRVENVTNTKWKFTVDGEEQEDIMKLIDTIQFEELLKESMNSIAWGISLLELGTITKSVMGLDTKVLKQYCVPRKHIKPERGVITKEQWDNMEGDYTIKYREGRYANYLAEIGQPDNLGILLNVAPYVILKKGGVSDWALFVQLFGQPLREYRYNGFDDAVRIQLEQNAKEMASAPYIILPDGTQVTLHEIKNNNTGEVHKGLVDYCDKMISIRVLGNTETTMSSQSSGFAQAKVHEKTQDEVYAADKQTIRKVLNSIIAPILFNLGWPVQGGVFATHEEKDIERVSKRMDIIKKAKDMGLPVDDDTIYEEADLTKPDNYDELKAEMEEAARLEQEAATAGRMPGGNTRASKPGSNKGVSNVPKRQVKLFDSIRTALADFFDPAP